MEFIGSIVVLAGVVALGAGAWGVAKGQVGWARILNRKVAGGVLVGSLGLMGAGGAMLPDDDKAGVQVTAGDSGPAATLPGDPATTSTSGPGSTAALVPADVTGTTVAATAPTGRATTATTGGATTSTTKVVTTSTTQKTTTSTGGSGSTTSSSGPSTTTSSTGPDGSCTASVSDPNPESPNGSVTVNVSSTLPHRGIELKVRYKSTTTEYSGTTNGAGVGSVTFQIGRATEGYEVEVEARVGGDAKCFTAFTPV